MYTTLRGPSKPKQAQACQQGHALYVQQCLCHALCKKQKSLQHEQIQARRKQQQEREPDQNAFAGLLTGKAAKAGCGLLRMALPKVINKMHLTTLISAALQPRPAHCQTYKQAVSEQHLSQPVLTGLSPDLSFCLYICHYFAIVGITGVLYKIVILSIYRIACMTQDHLVGLDQDIWLGLTVRYGSSPCSQVLKCWQSCDCCFCQQDLAQGRLHPFCCQRYTKLILTLACIICCSPIMCVHMHSRHKIALLCSEACTRAR